jgi:hypothetical protein
MANKYSKAASESVERAMRRQRLCTVESICAARGPAFGWTARCARCFLSAPRSRIAPT